MTEVVVVPTGTANIASVLAGLRRVGGVPRVSDDAGDVKRAVRVMLPGVGSFGSAMSRLEEGGLAEALRERVLAGRPTLSICVGLQVLWGSSDESSGVSGLGVVDGVVGRFKGVRVPQFGWNRVRVDDENAGGVLESGFAYFANSFRVGLDDALVSASLEGWRIAESEHGGRFVAGMERGPVVACQFHPELSGRYGLGVMRRWLAA